jgi:cbb3-type cytochrome oxidase subunit 3
MFAVLEIIDYVFLVLLFLFFTGSSAYAMFRPRDRARLFRLERKLDLMLKHLSIDISQLDVLSEEARKLADAGQKIAAIKAHREQTGLGLRDAKDDVEAYLAAKAK